MFPPLQPALSFYLPSSSGTCLRSRPPVCLCLHLQPVSPSSFPALPSCLSFGSQLQVSLLQQMHHCLPKKYQNMTTEIKVETTEEHTPFKAVITFYLSLSYTSR